MLFNMEYRNGTLCETWKDKVKDYAIITAVTLPGLIALWCWGAVFGASMQERYHSKQNQPQAQVERIAPQESKLQELLK